MATLTLEMSRYEIISEFESKYYGGGNFYLMNSLQGISFIEFQIRFEYIKT